MSARLPETRPPGDIRRPCHIGIATNDLDEAMRVLGGQFNLTWGDPKELTQPLTTPTGLVTWHMRRVHSREGPMKLELLEGSVGSTWSTERLAELHHFAFWSQDLASEADAHVADGWTLEATFSGGDSRAVGFAYLTKPGAARIELVER